MLYYINQASLRKTNIICTFSVVALRVYIYTHIYDTRMVMLSVLHIIVHMCSYMVLCHIQGLYVMDFLKWAFMVSDGAEQWWLYNLTNTSTVTELNYMF